jgi:hypothetical protein
MVLRLRASRIHPRGSPDWAVPVAFLSTLKLSALFFSDRNIIPQHGVQVNRTMVIGPYDKRLKRSRCLNCIARHTKASDTWLHDRDKCWSDNSFSVQQERRARLVRKPHSSVGMLVRRLRSFDSTTNAISCLLPSHSRRLPPVINKACFSSTSSRAFCLAINSQAEPASGPRMPYHSCLSVADTTLRSRVWGLLSHMPNIEEVDMARLYLQRPSNRIKTVLSVSRLGLIEARARGIQRGCCRWRFC